MTHSRAMTGLLALLAINVMQMDAAANEMLPDPAFSQSAVVGEWWATPNIKFEYKAGALCGLVAGGTEKPWDAILGLNGLTLRKGEQYRMSVTVSGDPAGPMRALAQKGVEPWAPEGEIKRRLSPDKQTVSEDFTAKDTHTQAQLVFQLGGADESWRFCLHSASLQSGQKPAAKTASTRTSAIRVNQLAYFPNGPKHATLVRKGRSSASWKLVSASGETVASGSSKAAGRDASSGLEVHTIDFSGFRGKAMATGWLWTLTQAHPSPFLTVPMAACGQTR
jgi:endoglucanase